VAPRAAVGAVPVDAGGVVALGSADAIGAAAGPDVFGGRGGRDGDHGRYVSARGRRSARLRAALRGATAQDNAGCDSVSDGGIGGGGGGEEGGEGDGGRDVEGSHVGRA